MKKQVKLAALLLAVSLMAGNFAGCRKSTENSSSDGFGTADSSEMISSVDNTVSGEPGSDESSSGSSGNTQNGGKVGSSQGGNTGASSQGGNTQTNVETKGKTFTVVSTYLSSKRSNNMDLYAELFLERVEEVEEELGCEIKIVNSVYPSIDWLAPQIRAGKKVADLLHVEMRELVPLVSSGYVKAWNDVPGVNVNDANLNNGITQVSTIKGKTYGISMLKPEEVRYCGVMNKTLLKKYGIDPDEIYKKIDNGTWTFNALLEYAQKIQKNASFTGFAVDADPTYFIEMLMSANNGRIVTMDSAGNATATYNSANVREAAQFMYDLVHTYNVYDTSVWKSNATTAKNRFVKGNVAFMFTESWDVAKNIRQNVKNFDYGMIMLPKGPKGTGYVSGLEHANMFVTTSTNKDLDFTAKVLNALIKPPKGQSGTQWWLDEVQVDMFQRNDTQSIAIYKKLLDSPTIDLGLCLSSLEKEFKSAILTDAIIDNKTSVSAAFDSINGKLDGTIKDVYGSLASSN